MDKNVAVYGHGAELEDEDPQVMKIQTLLFKLG
jgi:hypothetical protein